MTVADHLINDWQQRFPLCPEPFAELGQRCGVGQERVLAEFKRMQESGSLGRIGGIWGSGAGGAALLCAFAVPPQRMEAVAALVSAHAGVNHNYEREHAYNLWFVITGADPEQVATGVSSLEQACGLQALRLPMQRAYRINLGFDLRRPHAAGCAARAGGQEKLHDHDRTVQSEDRTLAALVEDGLPLIARPYAAWAQALGCSEAHIFAKLEQWLSQGTLRRFGAVVRHHELGFSANAMCVFDVADEDVDAHADILSRQPGVTLCYRRARAPGWPYNLYCMLHGRERSEVLSWLEAARKAADLEQVPQTVLFSRRRFKQCGARYFRNFADLTSGSKVQETLDA
ncbi:Lrp/AsnC family transcriptional regulator [Paucibacter sp. TC2R-5]|uniref:siroheme decarboxylase subunit beta n=1 Tax=Paucibacter sp. TC2R-5 TaxID=2893555 RepID=UPI0021E4E88D|nr:Lrp/AsnC family transcriptional regulator [Paucibacter sp. TC2R-5]MCV2358856.1 Lrp/AsnC family transcriptional regulator [Paucibacter sp. TC2R-5]